MKKLYDLIAFMNMSMFGVCECAMPRFKVRLFGKIFEYLGYEHEYRIVIYELKLMHMICVSKHSESFEINLRST